MSAADSDAARYRIPDQHGRIALVTGANSGIGLAAATRLAEAGAQVVLACRNPTRAEAARTEVAAAATGPAPEAVALDLASMSSVRAAAEQVRDLVPSLDVLVNNAGVMALPRSLTEDGWERQLATNHLGHFALTALVMDLLERSGTARVVTVSSGLHRLGRIDFDDLDGGRRYNRWIAYGSSKLANLLFAFELQRRLSATGSPTISTAAHPGWAATHLQTSGRGVTAGPRKVLFDTANRFGAQPAAMGALPTLHAATSPHVVGGGFYGPSHAGGMRGFPVPVSCSAAARDADTARRLWEVSEQRTAVSWDLVPPSPLSAGGPG